MIRLPVPGVVRPTDFRTLPARSTDTAMQLIVPVASVTATSASRNPLVFDVLSRTIGQTTLTVAADVLVTCPAPYVSPVVPPPSSRHAPGETTFAPATGGGTGSGLW